MSKKVISLKKLGVGYSFFAVVFTMILATVVTFMIYNMRVSNDTSNDNILSFNASMIDKSISESFDYTNRVSIFMGREIVNHGVDDLEFIYNLFISTQQSQYKVQELFSWSMFDWVDPDGMQLVNGKKGVAKDPPDMNHRDYVRLSPQHPWTLQLSKPAIGNPSGRWVIPAGTGITDDGNNYLGTIVVGFNIAILTQKIEKLIDHEGVRFVILDKEGRLVSKSSDNDIDPMSLSYSEMMKDIGFNYKGEGNFEEPIEYRDVKYMYYREFDKYPYTILLGFKSDFLTKQFYTLLLPRVLELLGFAIFFFATFYFFRSYIIKPITTLSDEADRITKGQEMREIPQSSTYETHNLAQQMRKVSKYVAEEKRRKEELERIKVKLEEVLRDARKSSRAKEDLTRKIRIMQKEHLISIEAAAEIIRSGNSDNPQEMAERIMRLVQNLNNVAASSVNRRLINVAEVIEECVTIYKDLANDRDIALIYDPDEDIPPAMIDEVHFRQIITGMLHHSFVITPREREVKVKCYAEFNDNADDILVVIVEDNGFGMDEETRKKIVSEYQQDGSSRDTDGSNLALDDIRRLVVIHQGEFHMDAVADKGTTFTLRLPYVEEQKDNGDKQQKEEGGKDIKDDKVVKLFHKSEA